MAYTDADTANYRGELYLIGNYQTPFLSSIGGLNTGERSASFEFPLAQPYSLDSASQNVQSEDTAAAAGTPITYTRAQDVNTCQIMKYDAAVTFKKQSTYGLMSGINTNAINPVNDELTFQKQAALRQMAIDVEYSFLNGSYTVTSTSATNTATRGIVTASAAGTNTVAASGAALSKSLIDELLREMAGNGAQFINPVIFVNALNKQRITDAYGYAPEDRNIGGLNIRQIETDFAMMGVVYAPQMDNDDLLIADLAVCSPVFVPVMFDGEDFNVDMVSGSDVLWVPTAVTAAKKGGFYYTQIGLDYGPEEYHGTITGLATS
jgi:hypothetical protein